MSSSALAAGLRHLRGKLAAQEHLEDGDEQLLHAFTSRRDESAFAASKNLRLATLRRSVFSPNASAKRR